MKPQSYNYPVAYPIGVFPRDPKNPNWMEPPVDTVTFYIDRHPDRCICSKCKAQADR